MTLKSLRDSYPAAHKHLKEKGFTNIAEMMCNFGRAIDMDRALGCNSAAHHWINMKNDPSERMEQRARIVVQNRNYPAEYVDRLYTPTPSTPTPSTPGTVLMVVCPPGADTKVKKVLEMLSCEVEEI